ncbi:MAG: hypothetical protein ACI8ZV_001947, partial [Chitinophagales bacterium]
LAQFDGNVTTRAQIDFIGLGRLPEKIGHDRPNDSN